MTSKENGRIPVDKIVAVENVKFPAKSKRKMVEVLFADIHYGDKVTINGLPYRYTGEFEEE